MSAPVIEVSDLTKTFRTYRREWHRVASWFGASPIPAEEPTVLEGVSFDLLPGQALGLVGRNGAGKSTLLKLITGTLAPTRGRVTTNGYVSAILELGLGFNPELTGRQNVIHSAGLMGYTRDRIAALMPEIEAFAEVGEYFDQPMRTYSSGMQMRIAFSVATAVRPEVLIVDEALSVGDAYFQHKSFGRIRQFLEQGTSLLLVSHDPASIQGLCNRALLLEDGQVISDGEPDTVIDYYNALIAEQENSHLEQSVQNDGAVVTRSGNRHVKIRSVSLHDADSRPIEYVGVGQEVTLSIGVRADIAVSDLTIGYTIRDRLGQPVYGTNTYHHGYRQTNLSAGEEVLFKIRFFAALGEGTYSVTVAAHKGESHLVESYDWWDRALLFTAINKDAPEFVGMAWLPPVVECVR